MKIKNILYDSGNPSFWSEQDLFYSKIFMKSIVSKQQEDQYLQSWNLEVNQNRKCTIYRIFKEKHGFERYLLELEFVEKMALCNMRTGNHNLPISKQRYTNEVDVKCTLFDTDETCDEFHVLFVCKFFEEKRKLLLKKFFIKRPNTYKMNILFNCESPKEIKNLGKFCKVFLSNF